MLLYVIEIVGDLFADSAGHVEYYSTLTASLQCRHIVSQTVKLLKRDWRFFVDFGSLDPKSRKNVKELGKDF